MPRRIGVGVALCLFIGSPPTVAAPRGRHVKASLVAELDACLFLLDCLPNMTADQVRVITQPTRGFGWVVFRPRRASCRAVAMHW